MNKYTRNGVIVGLFAGFVAAAVNWEGRPIAAASAIFFGALAGWLIGNYIGKRNTL